MSELQLGLIVIGVLVVAGVYGFNRFQERQLRRRMERGFHERPADVLLDEHAPHGGDGHRIEPRVSSVDAAASDGAARAQADETGAQGAREPSIEGERAPAAVTPAARQAPAQSRIDYVCSIEAAEPLAHAALNQFHKAASALGKPVAISGWSAASNEWIALPCAADLALSRLQASLQLADRTGPANRVQLSSMRDLVHQFAEQAGASCECPEIDQAAQTAAEIDRFCARVDVSIGCTVMPQGGAGLPGTKVRGLLESAGFMLESSGRFVLRAEDGTVLMAAEHSGGEALSAERLRAAPVPGLTLTMDVPRVPGGARVFDRMIELGRQLAHALDASMVDDNRAELTEAGVKVIRQQLRSVHGAMEAEGIPAGGALAARLFS
ncbi:MAG: hypothetical protein IT531_05215 [Burkholderiales bacterium]|nr:hypothetical protein [Burkholderiales bacterium]